MPDQKDPLLRLMLVPVIAASLADAEASIDAIQLTARRRSEKVHSQALAATAAASAALDGVDPAIAAALLLELEELPVRQSLLQALAKAHASVATHEPLNDRGRPRPDFTENDRLIALADIVASSHSPALLVAAIAHAELIAMKPFSTGNGLIARAIARRIMMESGLDPTGLVLTDVGLRDLGIPGYRAAIDAYRSGGQAGVSAWVIHCGRSVELGVDALKQLITQQQ